MDHVGQRTGQSIRLRHRWSIGLRSAPLRHDPGKEQGRLFRHVLQELQCSVSPAQIQRRRHKHFELHHHWRPDRDLLLPPRHRQDHHPIVPLDHRNAQPPTSLGFGLVVGFMEVLDLGNSLGRHRQLQDCQHALGDNVPRHPLHEQLRRLHR
jgi:hypothetical protein